VDVNVLANDDSAGAPLTLTVNSDPAHGTATVDASPLAAKISPAVAAIGPNITYTPDPGFLGTDAFTYKIETANGSAIATVSIDVIAPPPTAVDDTATTTSGTAVTVHVTANDSANGGGALALNSVGTPAHGAAVIDGTDVIYTPADGFLGTDHFGYEIKTAYGTADATVTVTVTGAGVANTGTPTEQLVGWGAGLLLTGGLVTAVGRRRRPVPID